MDSSETNFSSALRVRNATSVPKKLWIEPWGDELVLESGVVLTIVAYGPSGDCLEVMDGDPGITVYGWPGSTLRLFKATQLMSDYSIPAPSTPQWPSAPGSRPSFGR